MEKQARRVSMNNNTQEKVWTLFSTFYLGSIRRYTSQPSQYAEGLLSVKYWQVYRKNECIITPRDENMDRTGCLPNQNVFCLLITTIDIDNPRYTAA